MPMPRQAEPAATRSIPRSPIEVSSLGTRNTPTKAPNLPTPADIPWPVVRALTGNNSEGRTNVVMLGPKLYEQVADAENGQEGGHMGGERRYQPEHGEGAGHHAEADELERAVADPVHKGEGQDVAGKGKDEEDCQAPDQLGRDRRGWRDLP